jgi:hypothetical protein
MPDQNESNNIYNIHTDIKPYKLKKLFYSRNFRSLYYDFDDEVNILQREYQLCTHLWLRWFRKEEIVIVMGWWYHKHNLKGNWGRLKTQIIPDTYSFTRSALKERKHQEYLRRKERQRQKKLESKQKEGKRRAA